VENTENIMKINNSNNYRAIVLTALMTCLYACSQDSAEPDETPIIGNNITATTSGQTNSTPPNILVIIGDDMGNETLSCYELGESPAKTATLDQLCDEGVKFTNFWSQPVCSPTRATIMTGRYGFRTGVGRPTGDAEAVMGEWPTMPEKPAGAPFEASRGAGMGGGMAGGMGGGMGMGEDPANPSWGLTLNEFTFPMAFKKQPELGYSTAAIGKWHLADSRNGWQKHPNTVGFDHFSGDIRGILESYFTWNKVINGEFDGTTGYAPDDKVNDAISWIKDQDDKPWLLWLAFNLPHTPFHLPPENRWQDDHSDLDPSADPRENSLPYFKAMMESMDSNIGRLLDSLPEDVRNNTYVIFLGDNGTGSNVVQLPFRTGRAKGTIYEGGVNVPLIVSGPGVAKGAVSEALVNSVDIFSTILDMTGISVEDTVPETVTIDSVSFLPALSNPQASSNREFLYADVFGGNFSGVADADYAIRNDEFKLLRNNGEIEFYNLTNDPYEYINILDREMSDLEKSEYEKLEPQVNTRRASN
jgi:arylsulfatase B